MPKKQEIQRVRWNELIGNPYLQRLNPLMLKDQGRIIQKCVKLGKGHTQQNVEVVYDREFVYRWLEEQLIKPLGITQTTELDTLIEDYFQWKNRKQQTVATDAPISDVSTNAR